LLPVLSEGLRGNMSNFCCYIGIPFDRLIVARTSRNPCAC
jgi:hypothetical protein